jgi:two-component sensor histidine kinase
MQALLEFASYMPHGYCLFWQPWLVALYAGSDALIFLAYAAIPVALLMFLRRRPDIRYRGLVALVAAFILLCGISHLVSLVTLWDPVYPLHGLVKLVTGLVSAVTATVLFFLIPRLVAIPSPHQLEEANARLRAEIESHERTLAELRDIQKTLEEKVEQRTFDLTHANQRLSVMTDEAIHRSRNLLAVVTALAQQTARDSKDTATFILRFIGRLGALSNATASVMSRPASISAPLDTIARRQLEPVLLAYGDRISLCGAPIETNVDAAQQIALALHELATNAIKFGALAVPEGTVEISWRLERASSEDEELVLWWKEDRVAAAREAEAGFREGGLGTRLLTAVVPTALRETARRSFADGGMLYELRAPAAMIQPQAEEAETLVPHMASTPVRPDDRQAGGLRAAFAPS